MISLTPSNSGIRAHGPGRCRGITTRPISWSCARGPSVLRSGKLNPSCTGWLSAILETFAHPGPGHRGRSAGWSRLQSRLLLSHGPDPHGRANLSAFRWIRQASPPRRNFAAAVTYHRRRCARCFSGEKDQIAKESRSAGARTRTGERHPGLIRSGTCTGAGAGAGDCREDASSRLNQERNLHLLRPSEDRRRLRRKFWRTM